jgi:hypothetical protein
MILMMIIPSQVMIPAEMASWVQNPASALRCNLGLGSFSWSGIARRRVTSLPSHGSGVARSMSTPRGTYLKVA